MVTDSRERVGWLQTDERKQDGYRMKEESRMVTDRRNRAGWLQTEERGQDGYKLKE